MHGFFFLSGISRLKRFSGETSQICSVRARSVSPIESQSLFNLIGGVFCFTDLVTPARSRCDIYYYHEWIPEPGLCITNDEPRLSMCVLHHDSKHESPITGPLLTGGSRERCG